LAGQTEGEGCRAAAQEVKAGISAASYGSAGPLCFQISMTNVYILRSIENPERHYVGVTRDLRARLKKHNAGEVSHTPKYVPWTIKTYIGFADEKQAFAFEKYLKSPSGRAFAKKHL